VGDEVVSSLPEPATPELASPLEPSAMSEPASPLESFLPDEPSALSEPSFVSSHSVSPLLELMGAAGSFQEPIEPPSSVVAPDWIHL